MATVYIAQNAAGAGNGSDCSNPFALTFFNTSTNWGTQIGPDTVVHICGTITGTAGGTGLTFRGSGTIGHPITLLFEPGASLQAPYWGTGYGNNTGAIVAVGRSDIVIDGGANGYIENRLNGTLGGGCPAGACTSAAGANGIALASCTRCTVQNLTIKHIYVRTSTSDETNPAAVGIMKNGGTNANLTISNVTISDAGACVFYDLPSGTVDSAFTITGSNLFNCNAGIIVAGGNGSTGSVAGVSIHNNHLHDATVWNDPSPPYAYHHDGIHIWSYASTRVTGIQVYNNTFDGDLGSGTAWMYFENYSGTTEDIQIFNNLFHSPSTTCLFPCGPFALWLQTGKASDITPAKIYNNTFVNTAGGMGAINIEGSTGIQYELRNNTVQGYSNLLQIQPGTSLPLSSSDYNNWVMTSSSVIHDETNGTDYRTIATWSARCGCDSHGFITNPNLNAAYAPNAGSPLIGAGLNLTALGIVPLNADKNGIPRPASGGWDIGAYQFVGTGAPSAPSNLHIVN